MVADALRSAHRRAIAENPLTITIQRRERVRQDGGFREVASTVGPFAVRLYQERSALPREVMTLAGAAQTDARWALLADDRADLRAGPHVVDEFDVAGMGRFRITGVTPLLSSGALYGYQAECERVS